MRGLAQAGIRKERLTVECSDLLKNARSKSDCKKLLKVSPFMIRMEMQLDRLGLNADEKVQVTKTARTEADKIQGEIEKELNDLVKDVLKLQKEDAAGNPKAEGEAEKKIEAAHKKIESQLPLFGRRIRKAVEAGFKSKGRKHKVDSSVKSSASGSFKEIVLIADFQSGSDSEFQSAFGDTAKSLEQVTKDAVEQSTEEEKQREGLKRGLSDELKDIKEYKARKNKEEAEDGDGQQEQPRTRKSSLSSDEYDSKGLRGKARSMENNFGQYAQHLEKYKKTMDKATSEYEKQLIKLNKAADQKEKTALRQTKERLKKLQTSIGNQAKTAARMTKQLKGTFTLKSWEDLVTQHLKTLRNADSLSVKEMEQAVRKLQQLFKAG